jgi:hypothetical protein
VRRALKRDPDARNYRDVALTPAAAGDLDELEMFSVSDAARTAADKARKRAAA